MVRIKLENLQGELVARRLLDSVDGDSARDVAYREAAVQVLEQLTDMRIGTLYVHLDTPSQPWMLTDLGFDGAGRIRGSFSRKNEEEYHSSDIADWRRF